MPVYEYKCEKCGDLFEVRQKFADEPVTIHEKCGGPVERLISVPSLQFKGSGFYLTDYGRGTGNKTSENKPSENGSAQKGDSAATKSSGTSESSSSATPASSSSTESKPSSSESKASTSTESK